MPKIRILSERERRWAASIVRALEQGRITPDSVKRLPPYWAEVLTTYQCEPTKKGK